MKPLLDAALCLVLMAGGAAVAQPATQDDVRTYRSAVINASGHFRRYPRQALEAGQEGTAVVTVEIGPGGLPPKIALERSTGHSSLDEAALRTVTSAVGQVEIPNQLRGKLVYFQVPVHFALKRRPDGASPGIGTSNAPAKEPPRYADVNAYATAVQARIRSYVRIAPEVPDTATVTFVVRISEDGTLSGFERKTTSGSHAYDQAVVEAIVKSQPFPLLGAKGTPQRPLELVFRARD